MNIKAYGYCKGESDSDSPSELSEVTLVGTPTQLREIANFINQVANKIENSEAGEHFHLRDACASWVEDSADVIIAKP